MPTLHFQDDRAEVHRIVVGPLDNNVFVLRCRRSGRALLVDAADEPDEVLAMCAGLGVQRVVETHGHRDHIRAVPAVREAGYRVAVSAADAPLLPGYDDLLEDGSVVEVGDLAVHVVATPGHTPGSMCFRVEGAPLLFSGDTLFPGGPGATGGDPGRFATILDSIERRLFSLPPDTLVLPGHGADTTIGAELPKLADWAARGW